MPLGQPPREGLDAFPSALLPRTLHRLHRREVGVWWFASATEDPDDGGRFDLQPPAGACYLADSPLGAALEVFRDEVPVLPESSLQQRRRGAVTVDGDAPEAADFTAPAARGWGITLEIHADEQRPRTRAWAEALFAAGWRSLPSLIRHQPGGDLTAITLLDRAGAHPPTMPGGWHTTSHEIVDDADLIEALAAYGIEVLPDLQHPRFVGSPDEP